MVVGSAIIFSKFPTHYFSQYPDVAVNPWVHTFQNIFGKKIIIIFGPKSVQNLAFLIIIVQYIQEQA